MKSPKRILAVLTVIIMTTVNAIVVASPLNCGDSGVWVYVLGSGDLSLDNDRSSPSYLILIDDKARVLVGAGPGTALRFDSSEVDFRDLEVVLIPRVLVDQTSDLPALIVGSSLLRRNSNLYMLGPDGNTAYPSFKDLVNKLIGPDGAYSHLHPFLSSRSPARYEIRLRDVTAIGRSRWSGFGTENFELSAVPVNHHDVPSLAWRVDTAEHSVVFAGDFNNQKDIIADFAKDADMLIFTHSIPDSTVGAPRKGSLVPSQIGSIAERANVRFIVLGGRGWRTFGHEVKTLDIIKARFDRRVLFASDMDCWGL